VHGEVFIQPEEWPEDEDYIRGRVRLTAENFRAPSRSLRIVEESIAPHMIHFQLSPIELKSMQVTAQTVGQPPRPYRRSTGRPPEVEPPRVYVSGPRMYFNFYKLVTAPIDLTDVTPEQLSYVKEDVPVILELRKGLLEEDRALRDLAAGGKPMEFVDAKGALISPEDVRVRVKLNFELEETRRETLPVKLWALVPLGGQEKPFAVTCKPSSLVVTFAGTDAEIKTVLKNKQDPAFGLYFLVESTDKFGIPIPKSLPDLKWDPEIIPRGVTVERAQGAPGTVVVTLVPAAGSGE
jgi:hypothetical protein